MCPSWKEFQNNWSEFFSFSLWKEKTFLYKTIFKKQWNVNEKRKICDGRDEGKRLCRSLHRDIALPMGLKTSTRNTATTEALICKGMLFSPSVPLLTFLFFFYIFTRSTYAQESDRNSSSNSRIAREIFLSNMKFWWHLGESSTYGSLKVYLLLVVWLFYWRILFLTDVSFVLLQSQFFCKPILLWKYYKIHCRSTFFLQCYYSKFERVSNS